MKTLLRFSIILFTTTLVLVLVSGTVARAQVSSFPYLYAFNNFGGTQDPITGDGNWSSQATTTGNWTGTVRTGTPPPGGSAEKSGFKTSATYARLRVRLNTSGKAFTGLELFEFNMKRTGNGTSAGNTAATVTTEYSTDGVNYTTIAGPTALSTYLPNTSWNFKSYLLPLGVGGNSSVYLVIKITSGSNTDNHDQINVDDVSISGGALPIQLASFAASVIRNNPASQQSGWDVEVVWKTVSETNNYGFEVYRKRGESADWNQIGFVEGHGTTLAPQSYTYIDQSVAFGKHSYRIKQVDLDGNSQTFPEMEVNVGVGPDKFVLAQNYPNPFNPSTIVEFVVPQSGFATIKVYNMLGQEIATLFEGNADAGRINTARFIAPNLPSGLYFYTLRSAGKTDTKRMLLMK